MSERFIGKPIEVMAHRLVPGQAVADMPEWVRKQFAKGRISSRGPGNPDEYIVSTALHKNRLWSSGDWLVHADTGVEVCPDEDFRIAFDPVGQSWDVYDFQKKAK